MSLRSWTYEFNWLKSYFTKVHINVPTTSFLHPSFFSSFSAESGLVAERQGKIVSLILNEMLCRYAIFINGVVLIILNSVMFIGSSMISNYTLKNGYKNTFLDVKLLNFWVWNGNHLWLISGNSFLIFSLLGTLVVISLNIPPVCKQGRFSNISPFLIWHN